MRSNRFSVLIIVLLLAVPTSVVAQTSSSLDSAVCVVNKLFERAEYVAAELEARRALETVTMPDSVRIEFECIVAFSLVAQGKQKSAVDHFIQILAIDNAFNLDPVFTSPKIIEVFERAKKEFNAAQNMKSKQLLPMMMNNVRSVSYRTLVFPGWEQLYQGREKVGYCLMGTGILSVGLTIYFDFERRDHYKTYMAASTTEEATKTYTKYNRSYKSEIYSACAFLLVYIYSEIDAFVFLPEGTSVQLDNKISFNAVQANFCIPIK